NYVYKILNKGLAGRSYDYFYVDKYELIGDYVPSDLPASGLSDIHIVDEVNNIIYLSEWMSFGRPLTFRIWKIDGNKKTHWVSDEIEGICTKMSLDGSDVVLSAFRLVDENAADLRSSMGVVTVRPKFLK
ncbi:MAG: hypothetical protein KDD38_07595, partial [Bdellovibrionales bacterium]|nr:hypothetical protein [Bdellovibrionales bacterium]